LHCDIHTIQHGLKEDDFLAQALHRQLNLAPVLGPEGESEVIAIGSIIGLEEKALMAQSAE
jgi:hypothetical protein